MLRQSIYGFASRKSGGIGNWTCYPVLVISMLSFACGPALAQPSTPTSNSPTKSDSTSEVNDLLPVPPNATKTPGPLISTSLADAPEVALHARQPKPASRAEARASSFEEREQFEKVFVRVRQLNQKQTDGFILALRNERSDLAGLPFLLGDSCRQGAEGNLPFKETAEDVRLILRKTPDRGDATQRSEMFWGLYVQFLAKQMADRQPVADGPNSKDEKKPLEQDGQLTSTSVRHMALMQMLGAESPELRRTLVWQLAVENNRWANRALAQLAVFSPEEEVRLTAITALGARPDTDFADILWHGLHYPWPPIVKQAADFVVKLGRPNLAPNLIELLDEPDPRAPVAREVNGKKTFVVREMVRINHHRSCLLCHAPAGDNMPKNVLTAQAPLPGELPLAYYAGRRPSQMVRLDVTYLRQDFSAMLPCENPTPRSKTERFDFLVRERVLSETEAVDFRKRLEGEKPAKLAPHREVALAALRQMSGKDAPPNAAAWREKLK